jgi:hypothetical protein
MIEFARHYNAASQLQKVSSERAKAFAESAHMPYVETSAKDGTNVTAAFRLLAHTVLAKRDESLTIVEGVSLQGGVPSLGRLSVQGGGGAVVKSCAGTRQKCGR